MADLIHMDHRLVSIINRFGIELGFGDRSIGEVCEGAGVNPGFFIEIINSYRDEDYSPEDKLKDFPVGMITDYLGRTHDHYKNIKLPEVEELIYSMIESSYKEPELSSLLKEYFRKYREELLAHIKREDELVFPYSIQTEKEYLESKNSGVRKDSRDNFSIMEYLSDHDDVEAKLYDLKNIIIKYLPPLGNPSAISRLITELFMLEKDLNDHSRIEEKVLVPKVLSMEKELYGKEMTATHTKEEAPVNNREEGSVLSEREKNILREVALGLTNKEIADKLFISVHTVTTHRKNITQKLGIKTASGLTIYAILNGIISIGESQVP